MLWGCSDPWLVRSSIWAVLWDAMLQGSLGMGRAVREAGGLGLQLTVREAPHRLGMACWALPPPQLPMGTRRP